MTSDEVHNRARYRRGCRCGLCRSANRAYEREWRASAAPKLCAAVAISTAAEDVTSCVSAVIAELTLIGPHGRPGLAAGALAMAKILDDPCAVPQHPAAAGRLFDVLDELHRCAPRRGGKLAVVRRMTVNASPNARV